MGDGTPVKRACVGLILFAALARGDEHGDARAGVQVFVQPVSGTPILVVTPSVNGRATPRSWLHLDVEWAADVVTGATPRTYGSPDVVTAATQFTELRNVIGTSVAAEVGPTVLEAGYSYGTENDFRTHLLRAGVRVDLLDHNTVLAASYSHSWSSVCDLDNASQPVTLRQPLDNSRGCFSDTPGLTTQPLDTDAVEVSAIQTFTPKLVGALVGSYQHLSGFQSNPYRRVRLFGGTFQAQESHPMVRDRGAVTARLKYAVERLRASLGADLRLYRDTWGIQSITGEIQWTQPFRKSSRSWLFEARTRGYVQSGAFFFRDASQPDSYEIAGPVGSFFTADQELAPLANLLLGFRAMHVASSGAGARIWRIFTDLDESLGLDYFKIFALTPDPPNAERAHAFATALVLTLSATGRF